MKKKLLRMCFIRGVFLSLDVAVACAYPIPINGLRGADFDGIPSFSSRPLWHTMAEDNSQLGLRWLGRFSVSILDFSVSWKGNSSVEVTQGYQSHLARPLSLHNMLVPATEVRPQPCRA